jgi:hypothetical protein
MGIGWEKQENAFLSGRVAAFKTRMPSNWTAFVGAVASRSAGVFPAKLLEEGCHSAEFDTTIHDGHHLLLSIGWHFFASPRSERSIAYLELDVNRGN